MQIQNLEQIRARHALQFKYKVLSGEVTVTGKDGGDAMKKIPSLILGSGLLAALAFGLEEKKKKGGAPGEMEPSRPGHQAIFDAIAEHLASPEIGITPGVTNAPDLIDHLVEANSYVLQTATDEALAWLGFARRFITGGEKKVDPTKMEDEPE